jgi:hypothetical protein
MTFSKIEMQAELRDFLFHFAGSVQRLYGKNGGGGLLGVPSKQVSEVSLAEARIEDTMLWKAVNDMYDFGISGIMTEGRDLGSGKHLDAEFCDAEMFLRGLTSLDQYLDEDETKIPRLSTLAVRTAVARHVLEGGERFTGFSEDDAGGSDLSFFEMALLADMDERSVRNAANPKLPNPLATVVHGKRTYVEREEAKRWLVERKGFVPTQTGAIAAQELKFNATASLQLSVKTMTKLQAKAHACGLPVESFIAQLLAE